MNKRIPAHVTVRSKDKNASAEKLIRKFVRKVKKAGIIEEIRERSHYMKPSDAKRLKRKRAKALAKKANKKLKKKI